MVVCKYWLEGRCYFGSRCRYEHTSHNYQSHADGTMCMMLLTYTTLVTVTMRLCGQSLVT